MQSKNLYLKTHTPGPTASQQTQRLVFLFCIILPWRKLQHIIMQAPAPLLCPSHSFHFATIFLRDSLSLSLSRV